MIKLSKRLEKIAEFVEKDDTVLDIGCDHALLDIYLANKYSKIYYASDLRESALDMARSNIKKYSCDKVVLRCGNGLDVLEEKMDINTIVISGMGYLSIIGILRNIKHLKNINKLIIQSNSNSEIVRKFILKNGFYIDKEHIVLDKNIYYIITSFKRGKKKYSNLDKEIGIMNDDILKDYINIEIKKNNVLLSIVPKKEIFRRMKIKRKLKYLNKKKNSM